MNLISPSKDNRKPFYTLVKEDQQYILSVLRTVVKEWSEKEITNRDVPMLHNFLNEHDEWNHEPLYEFIDEEIRRVTVIESKVRGNISRFDEVI